MKTNTPLILPLSPLSLFFQKSFSTVLIFFSVFFFMILSGCGEDEESTEQQNINISAARFFINTPDDWETLPKELYPSSVLLSKREPSYTNEISSLLSLSFEKGNDYPLDIFVARNLESIRQNSQDFQKLSQEEIFLSTGEPAILVQYQERYSKIKAKMEIYDLYVIKEEENKKKEYYSLTIAYDPSTSEDHKTFLRNVVSSFRFSE